MSKDQGHCQTPSVPPPAPARRTRLSPASTVWFREGRQARGLDRGSAGWMLRLGPSGSWRKGGRRKGRPGARVGCPWGGACVHQTAHVHQVPLSQALCQSWAEVDNFSPRSASVQRGRESRTEEASRSVTWPPNAIKDVQTREIVQPPKEDVRTQL